MLPSSPTTKGMAEPHALVGGKGQEREEGGSIGGYFERQFLSKPSNENLEKAVSETPEKMQRHDTRHFLSAN